MALKFIALGGRDFGKVAIEHVQTKYFLALSSVTGKVSKTSSPLTFHGSVKSSSVFAENLSVNIRQLNYITESGLYENPAFLSFLETNLPRGTSI